MGFKVASSEPDDTEDGAMELVASTELTRSDLSNRVWEWSQPLIDWIDFSTGEVLSGYQPSPQMKEPSAPSCGKPTKVRNTGAGN
jgi:hypothetical protein